MKSMPFLNTNISTTTIAKNKSQAFSECYKSSPVLPEHPHQNFRLVTALKSNEKAVDELRKKNY